MQLKYPDVAVDLPESRYASFEVKSGQRRIDAVFAGFEATLPDYVVKRESFRHYAIEIVTGGTGVLTLGGCEHVLQHGSVFTYGPGVPHRIASDARHPLRKFFIDLSRQPDRKNHPLLQPGACFHTLMADRMAALVNGIIQDASGGGDATSVRQRSIGLLLELAACPCARESSAHGVAYRNYQRVKAHIESRHHRGGTIEEFAAELHIDAAYLSRLFKRFGNETPYQFLTRLRMERASHLLLRHRNLSIQQISDSAGFANPFHFSTIFRRYFGVAPSSFRR